ncbi:hypothetical protein [Halomonas sp. MS1]|nr:hypothetical protein [Halomonas sp. MS1]UTD54915.1 hypothetical protein NF683_17475 [Halomonas sp. MS1]
MDWSLYEDEAGCFKPKRLSITKGPIKVKDETDLQDMRADLKGLPMEKAKQHFEKFFNDEYTYELEVEPVESAFNRAPKAVLRELYCFKGQFSALEELLDMQPGIDSIPLPLSEAQTHQALKADLIKRCLPSNQEEWESLLFHSHKVTELKALMAENGLEPKGRKAELAKDLAAFAVEHPEKLPPGYEFVPSEKLLPALKTVVSGMISELAVAIQGHPYYYQYNAWQELMREWPAYEWPWLADIVKSNGGAPGAAAIKEIKQSEKVSSHSSYDDDEWSGYGKSTPTLKVEITPPPIKPTDTPKPEKPVPLVNAQSPSKGESEWASSDFEKPVEVRFKYQGERDQKPKDRHVQIERVSSKGGRIVLKGMCLESMGMKMFMVDRMVGEIVSPVTGELLNPHEYMRLDDLRKAIALLARKPESKPVEPSADEGGVETTRLVKEEEATSNIVPEKQGIMRRILDMLGVK